MLRVLVSKFSGSSRIITIGDEEHLDELISKLEAESRDAKYFLPLGYSETVEEKLRRIRGSLSPYTKQLVDELLYDMALDLLLSRQGAR